MEACYLCPRMCGIDRTCRTGFCKVGANAVVARSMLHRWEEPCICFGNGSGAVFFSGCQLQCIFCQNHEISSRIKGGLFSFESLCDLFLSLQGQGACNVNLVSPTPHLNQVIPAIESAKTKGLRIPVVFNSSGYERAETLKRLDGLIDIYLPDFKFYSPDLAKKLCNAEDYFEIATKAISEMHRQTGPILWKRENELQSGTIVRHLILPGNAKDSINVIRHLNKFLPKDQIILSLMSQYTPMHKAKYLSPFDRKITKLEYQKVVAEAEKIDFGFLYTQSKESANTDFVPDF